MRWLIFAASLALSALGTNAAEPLIAEEQMSDGGSPVALVDPAVTVTPIPMPALVVELPSGANSAPKLRPLKKAKLEKKRAVPPTMLSRTERHQMALLAPKPKNGDVARDSVDDDNDDVPSVADLTLHRSFHRPKIASQDAEEEGSDDVEISDAAKLRLLLARVKAVEAHAVHTAMAQDDVAADELSETVRLRLLLARTRAVAAHEKKFS